MMLLINVSYTTLKYYLCRVMINSYIVQWNLSNPTHQGTREMHPIVQDVGIL